MPSRLSHGWAVSRGGPCRYLGALPRAGGCRLDSGHGLAALATQAAGKVNAVPDQPVTIHATSRSSGPSTERDHGDVTAPVAALRRGGEASRELAQEEPNLIPSDSRPSPPAHFSTSARSVLAQQGKLGGRCGWADLARKGARRHPGFVLMRNGSKDDPSASSHEVDVFGIGGSQPGEERARPDEHRQRPERARVQVDGGFVPEQLSPGPTRRAPSPYLQIRKVGSDLARCGCV